MATRHLIRYPGLQQAAARGAPVLAICAAIQVLGHWYETSSGAWWPRVTRRLRCASDAGVEHTLVHDAVEAITSCPPGHVEVVANYTAFLHLNRTFGRAGR